jgi:hypothetical protein
MSTFSPNLFLEEVARNADVGTWDTPTNNNWSIVDSVCGAIAFVSLNNSNVILNAAQFQCRNITFFSTLTGSVAITFSSTFTKNYEIFNACSGSSAFTITLATTVAGGQAICPPPGEIIDIYNDGTNLRYKNLGRIGEYWDYAGSSVPNWVSGCTVPPYLACTGGSVSSAFYPVLFGMIGGTLPDTRGRTRYALDAGTGRITGVFGSGNVPLAAGGDALLQTHTHGNTATVNDPTHVHGGIPQNIGNHFQGGVNPLFDTGGGVTAAAATGITVTMNNAATGSGGSQNLPPLYIGGITMIRAA